MPDVIAIRLKIRRKFEQFNNYLLHSSFHMDLASIEKGRQVAV